MREPAWNGTGWDLRILRGYGVLAPHYEFWLPTAGLAKLWSCLRTGGATPVGALAGSLSRCRGDSGVRHRYGGTRPAAGDLAVAGAALQQGLLPGPGDCGAHSVARQCAPAPAAAGAEGRCRRAGTELTLEDGTAAGQITSAAELPLASGQPRVCAGDDARRGRGAQPDRSLHGRSERREQPHLAAPPKF